MSGSVSRPRCVQCGQEGTPARATKISGGPEAVAPEGWIAGIPLQRYGGNYEVAEREMRLTCSEACWAAFSSGDPAKGLERVDIVQQLWCEEATLEEYTAAVEKHCLAKYGKLLGAYRDAPLEQWYSSGLPSEAAALLVKEGGTHPVTDDCRTRAYELADQFSQILSRRRERAGDQQVVEFLAQAAVLTFLAQLLRIKIDPRGLGPEWLAQLQKEMTLVLTIGDAEAASN